jgi:osmotically-inducible protein OsmY
MNIALPGVVCAMLLGSATAIAQQASTSDSADATELVKDSAITTDINSQLAAEQPLDLKSIHIDTDKDGVVSVSGSASDRDAADKAVWIARRADHVTHTHGDITIDAPADLVSAL